jgi:beta-glucosidase
VAATASVEASAVVVRGVVRNTGAVAGADVVQVYVNREVDGRVPVLGGFARVEVGAGAETEFTVRVPLDRLAVRDADAHAWRSPSGSYRLSVGRHAGDPNGVELVVDL